MVSTMVWTLDVFREQFPFVQVGSLSLVDDSLLTSRTLDKEVVATILREAVLPEIVKWKAIFRESIDGITKPVLTSLLPTLKGLSLGLNGVEPEVASVVFDDAPTGAVAHVVDQDLYEEAGHILERAVICKLVIEEKTCLLDNWICGAGDCFQLAAHMLHYGGPRFHSGDHSPIYGIQLAGSCWACTELRVDGIVDVENGVVANVPDDMDLDAQRRVASVLAKAQVKDGEHIVARYFIGDMPATGFSWRPPTPPAFHLVEILLKICVGAPVHGWGVADVKAKLAKYHDINHGQACF